MEVAIGAEVEVVGLVVEVVGVEVGVGSGALGDGVGMVALNGSNGAHCPAELVVVLLVVSVVLPALL